MALDPIVAAVEGGGYVSLLKLIPAVLVLAAWARLLTWVDKDAEATHLPRVALNISFLTGMVLAFALFFFLPTFIIAFAALLFLFAAEAGTYLILRQQKVGLKDLNEQFNTWIKSFSGGKKEAKLPPSQVGIIGKGGSQFPPPAAEDPERPAFDAVQAALLEPLKKNAELIAIAPGENGMAVKYQVDGMDYKGSMIEKTTGQAAITLLKSSAGLDVNDRRKPQRGMIKFAMDGRKREYRMDTAGNTAGEAARFLLDPKKRHDIKFDALGFTAKQHELLTRLIKEDRKGVILVAAPKGMGLSTTLYSIMDAHDAFIEHLHTVERDPEVDLTGITQNKVPAGATGPEEQKIVDWVISQQPDVIMAGRIEDSKSAQDLCEFAAEKRVYVGLRAASAMEALAQWRRLVGNDKLAMRNLELVIAQRVLRKLCMACKLSYAPDPAVVRKLNLNPDKAATLFQARTQPLRDPKGNPVPCDFCLDLRYKGRVGVFETMVVDDDMRAVLAAGGSEAQIKAAFRKQRGRYLQEEGLALVESGDTSVQEVLRVLKVGTPDAAAAPAAAAAPQRPPAARQPAK
jgi:type II secretory ATPase GspE/PulE/Tfp pilus assembly ATPase PilB-like protein